MLCGTMHRDRTQNVSLFKNLKLLKIVSLFLHVIAIYGLLELIARQEITTCCVSTWLT